MIRHSIIVPLARGAVHFERQLRELVEAASAIDPAYEILCVDDASGEREHLVQLCARTPRLRVVELPRRSGTGACLSAGIAAAQGDTIVALEAGDRFSPRDMARLVERLSRADLVCARRRASRVKKTWLAIRHLPRRLLLSGDVHDPSCLFWAARREAVIGLPPVRHVCRHLATWVAARGFRVCEVYVDQRRVRHASTTSDGWSHASDLLAAWWQSRQWRVQSLAELAEVANSMPSTRRYIGAASLALPSNEHSASTQTSEQNWRRSA